MNHVYCHECGFQNPETANYCAKCGTLLEHEPGDETTLSLSPSDLGQDTLGGVEPIAGPALVIRAGGGRVGEHFPLRHGVTTVGRSPDCDIFLDDVTVSRAHAVVTVTDRAFVIEDRGSLNGTFLNRRRIEHAELEDGDELQVGKYRLTFHAT